MRNTFLKSHHCLLHLSLNQGMVKSMSGICRGTGPAGQRYLSLLQPDPIAWTGHKAVETHLCLPIHVREDTRREIFAWFATGLLSKEASLVRKIQRDVERQIRGQNSSLLSCLPLDGNKSVDSLFCSSAHLKIIAKLQLVS